MIDEEINLITPNLDVGVDEESVSAFLETELIKINLGTASDIELNITDLSTSFNIELTITDLRVTPDIYEVFTPTEGQTVFTLGRSLVAVEINRSRIFINGVKLILTTDYTISGDQLDVSNYDVILTTTDIVEAYY